MLRLFFSLALPEKTKSEIREVQKLLVGLLPEQKLRLTSVDNLHLTLKFLGATPADRVDEIIRSADPLTKRMKPFKLKVDRLESFGRKRNVRILFLNVVGDVTRLAGFAADLESTMAPLGYSIEDRDYHPHITLVRAPRSQRKLKLSDAVLEKMGGFSTSEFLANRLELMQSAPTPNGSVYQSLKTWILS